MKIGLVLDHFDPQRGGVGCGDALEPAPGRVNPVPFHELLSAAGVEPGG